MNSSHNSRPFFIYNLIICVILVAIAIAVVYPLIFSGNAEHISSTTQFSINPNGTLYFSVLNATSPSVLYLKNSTASSDTFYLEGPYIGGPIESFSIGPGESVNASSSGGQISDMNLLVISSTASGAVVKITPLYQNLGIRLSKNIAVTNPPPLGLFSSSATASSTPLPTSVTTTVSQSLQSNKSSNQTSNQTQALLQKAMKLANESVPGALMLKFRSLYVTGSACTAPLYNSTYNTQKGSLPSGPNSFENVSAFTPTNVTIYANALGAQLVNITYSAVTHSSSYSGPMLILEINVSAASYLKKINYTGLLSGANTTTLNSTYMYQSKISGDCGAYIEP